mgnify:CR=1 FL=1
MCGVARAAISDGGIDPKRIDAIANAADPSATDTQALKAEPTGRKGKLAWDDNLQKQFFILKS